MYTNFLRTGVGVDSIHHLHDIQSSYRHIVHQKQDCAFLTTRRTPTRVNDLINGGSVYWIIKRQICARQIIVDIQTLKDEEDKNYCVILMDKKLILTQPLNHRHIQGWRYLPPEKAPTDIGTFDPSIIEDDMDPDMAKDLAEAGLL
jgi:hypothetical protein